MKMLADDVSIAISVYEFWSIDLLIEATQVFDAGSFTQLATKYWTERVMYYILCCCQRMISQHFQRLLEHTTGFCFGLCLSNFFLCPNSSGDRPELNDGRNQYIRGMNHKRVTGFSFELVNMLPWTCRSRAGWCSRKTAILSWHATKNPGAGPEPITLKQQG